MYSIDCAVESASRDKSRKVSIGNWEELAFVRMASCGIKVFNSPIDEVNAHAERRCKTMQRQTSIGFENLSVREDSHLSNVVTSMGRKDSGGE